jgi:hypothetical protein
MDERIEDTGAVTPLRQRAPMQRGRMQRAGERACRQSAQWEGAGQCSRLGLGSRRVSKKYPGFTETALGPRSISWRSIICWSVISIRR